MICVYILEAHAQDEWPIGLDFSCVMQHKTTEERIAAAQMLKTKFGLDIPVYVDTLSNAFNSHYAAWPERFYVIDTDGDIAYIAHPHDEWGFDRLKVELDARRSIRLREVDDSARRKLLPADSFRSKDLYSRLKLNRSVALSSSKFYTIWRHYDKGNTGFLPREVALLFLKELAAALEVEYNEDRAMVIIESCNSPTNELSKAMFEKVFAIWSHEQGISLTDSMQDAPTAAAVPTP